MWERGVKVGEMQRGGGEEGMGCRRKGVGSEREGMAVGEMQREGCVR